MIIRFGVLESSVIFILLFILTSLGVNYFKNKRNVVYIILIPTILLFGYRYSGTDIYVYENIISRIGEMQFLDIFVVENLFQEIGFKIISNIFFKIGGFPLVNIVLSMLILFPVYNVILEKKDRINVFSASFIYLVGFYITSFNIMRQFVAVAFLFIAINELSKNNKFKYFIYTVIAISFHNTALVSFFVYFYKTLPDIRHISFKKFMFVVGNLIIFIFVFFYVMDYTINNDYSSYLDSSMGGLNRDIYVLFFKAILLVMFCKVITKKYPEYNSYVIFAIVALVICFSGFYSPYIKRMYFYFTVFECISFSMIRNFFKQKILVDIGICGMYLSLFIVVNSILLSGSVIPLVIRI